MDKKDILTSEEALDCLVNKNYFTTIERKELGEIVLMDLKRMSKEAYENSQAVKLQLRFHKAIHDGEFIHSDSYVALCNYCHENFYMLVITEDNETKYEYNFCPHCGRRIEKKVLGDA